MGKFIRRLFEGDFKHSYWRFMNKFFGESKNGCLCTMREECQVCWTKWDKELRSKKNVV